MSDYRLAAELREEMIADYLRIHGPRMTDPEAARRLGVTSRTVQRYKTILRERGVLPPVSPGPVLKPGRTAPGWCMCGCGRRTRRYARGSGAADPRNGWNRYVVGHSARYARARQREQEARAAS